MESTAQQGPDVRRTNVNATARGSRRDTGPESDSETISPEMIQRILSRLGNTLRKLSVEQRSEVIRSLDVGAGDAAAADDAGGTPDADIVSSIMKGLRQEGMLIDRLIRLQGHDDYTVTHSLNVCILVVAQAARIGLPENRVREAGLAALLHDIGKEMTPTVILTKPGRLDLDEFDQVKKHPASGAKLLRRIDCGTELPMIVAFEHHIKFDRSGYPKVRTRGPLHIASYMTQIADVYDALRSFRPYQPSIELERTLSIMREGRGTEFEPGLFDNFVGILS